MELAKTRMKIRQPEIWAEVIKGFCKKKNNNNYKETTLLLLVPSKYCLDEPSNSKKRHSA